MHQMNWIGMYQTYQEAI